MADNKKPDMPDKAEQPVLDNSAQAAPTRLPATMAKKAIASRPKRSRWRRLPKKKVIPNCSCFLMTA
jgi:hypothetical protein